MDFYEGAGITLYGRNNSNINDRGDFVIRAFWKDSENHYLLSDLIGYPDGRLSWKDNDLAGAAIISKNISYTGYIKFRCGLIIQWGDILVNVNEGTIFTPSISYTKSYHVIVMGLDDLALFYYRYAEIIKLGNASSGINYTGSYISIGY